MSRTFHSFMNPLALFAALVGLASGNGNWQEFFDNSSNEQAGTVLKMVKELQEMTEAAQKLS